MKTRTSKTLMNSRLNTFVVTTICGGSNRIPCRSSGLDGAYSGQNTTTIVSSSWEQMAV